MTVRRTCLLIHSAPRWLALPVVVVAALAVAAPAQAAMERARITWDTPTDIDLYATDEAGTEASYQNPSAIPNATLSTDDTAGTGPEFFTDDEDPGTARTFQFRACYFAAAADVGPVTVSATITDGNGASRPLTVSLDAPGTCAELGPSNGQVPPDGDGDGVADAADRCPAVAAPGTPDGCPPDGGGNPGGGGPPPPVTGKQVNVEAVRGKVTVRLPDGRRISLAEQKQIPTGSVVDAKKGAVRLTSTAFGGGVQSAVFSGGIFKVTQSRGEKPLTTLQLVEELVRCAGGAQAAGKGNRVKKRRLWGSGKGSFRTRGRRSAATVTGTKWLVQDSCAGTLTRVERGKVKVRDFGRRKTVTVRAGEKYLAR